MINSINGTIIIQMLNFFIAYLMVRWAFKPLFHAVRSYREEHDYVRRLMSGIQNDIEQSAQVHQERWQLFSDHVAAQMVLIQEAQKIPPVAIIKPPLSYAENPLEKIPDTVVEQLVDMTIHTIEKKRASR